MVKRMKNYKKIILFWQYLYVIYSFVIWFLLDIVFLFKKKGGGIWILQGGLW